MSAQLSSFLRLKPSERPPYSRIKLAIALLTIRIGWDFSHVPIPSSTSIARPADQNKSSAKGQDSSFLVFLVTTITAIHLIIFPPKKKRAYFPRQKT